MPLKIATVKAEISIHPMPRTVLGVAAILLMLAKRARIKAPLVSPFGRPRRGRVSEGAWLGGVWRSRRAAAWGFIVLFVKLDEIVVARFRLTAIRAEQSSGQGARHATRLDRLAKGAMSVSAP
jgi:hypothetical protein